LTLLQAFSLISSDIGDSISLSENSSSLAIYYFTTGQNRTELGDYITNELSSYLTGDLDGFSVLSRNKIDEIYEEHKFQLSGLVDSEAIANMGNKLSAEYIGTGYLTLADEHIHLNFQLIHVESAEIISAESIDILIDGNISSFISNQRNQNQPEITQMMEIPEYQLIDPFIEFDTALWNKIQKDNDISVSVEGGFLKVYVDERQGVNGVNLTSTDFKIKTFAIEISFRNPDEEASWISITVGNLNHQTGASFQIEANIYDEYYLFRYKKKNSNTWIEDEDNILDELFGDESSNFHKLRLVYDKANKIAYGYVDDTLVSKVEDFSFNSRDRGQVILSANGRFKNINVEYDDFKSSLLIK